MATNTDIDFAAIEAEVSGMSEEDVRKLVLDSKVKQKLSTKKYYNAETAKKVRLKRAAIIKAAMARLSPAELAAINDQAKVDAEAQLQAA